MRTVPLYRQSSHVSGGVIQARFYIVTHSADELHWHRGLNKQSWPHNNEILAISHRWPGLASLQLVMNMIKSGKGGGKNLIKHSINVPTHSENNASMAVASPNALLGNQPKIT